MRLFNPGNLVALLGRIWGGLLMGDYYWIYRLPPEERASIELRYEGRIPDDVCRAAERRVLELDRQAKGGHR